MSIAIPAQPERSEFWSVAQEIGESWVPPGGEARDLQSVAVGNDLGDPLNPNPDTLCLKFRVRLPEFKEHLIILLSVSTDSLRDRTRAKASIHDRCTQEYHYRVEERRSNGGVTPQGEGVKFVAEDSPERGAI